MTTIALSVSNRHTAHGERHTGESVFFNEGLCFRIHGDGPRGSWNYGNSDLDGWERDGETGLKPERQRKRLGVRTDVSSLGLISE